MTFKSFAQDSQARIESYLDRQLADATLLDEAIRYSVFNGGKRVRPALVYATAQAVGLSFDSADPLAAAIELIHSYSLVHDDLPAMDDDDLRRGLPTCHKKYDEATAILVGDGLQSLGFQQLSLTPAATIGATLETLCEAAGPNGMVLGQAVDVASAGSALSYEQLRAMHRAKTGAMIVASCLLPAIVAQVEPAELAALQRYADAIGLAFQIQDDILDVTSDTDTLGKPQGSDIRNDKPTYVSLLGLEGARAELTKLHAEAMSSADELTGDSAALRGVADYIVSRVL
ncbi:polyprenyl synthetase family protein [Umboniibacter marinipuniceus]|uniref:Farnesyl-diphosphate synthase n=1 Tax=Umboniibacter marinipuniceus TaxID=569599 RepID=A0A3M0AB84_9GAMM|nr:farnesyl diphosphate synthase [Umboniibacter marinipuniceus]RMA82411.1 farnesyl-diphosphate synthase [Umboniibacter marinipuniceus]